MRQHTTAAIVPAGLVAAAGADLPAHVPDDAFQIHNPIRQFLNATNASGDQL